MPSTDPYDLPYPAGGDSPNGPVQLQALAEKVRDALKNGAGHHSYGKSIVSAEQFTASTSYTLLGTPDRVQNVVLPTDGLIFVSYQARVHTAGGIGAEGRAAIFIGESQLKARNTSGAPSVQEAALFGNVDTYRWLVTAPYGLREPLGSGAAATDTSDPATLALTTGESPVCVVAASAGTYDVSVRFKATSLQVWARERKLRVWSQAFG